MALITYFKAPLRCSSCGHNGTAWLYSTLGSRGATYQVGDCPGDDIQPIDFEEASFTVRRPEANEPVHVLTSWTCEDCRLENFGEIVFTSGCVSSIELVDLEPTTLARLHYISESAENMIETIIGESIRDTSGLLTDWLNKLRAALDAGRRW